MTYYSSVLDARIAARSLPVMIGVQDGPADAGRCPLVVGTASGVGHYGRPDPAKAEQVWGLVVGKVELEGGYLMRDGVFVELGEAAEWVRWGMGTCREERDRLERIIWG